MDPANGFSASKAELLAELDKLETRLRDSETSLAVLQERLRNGEEEKERQAIEYERRLTELNHAHAKQVKDQATYVSQDKHDGFAREFGVWRDQVTKALTLLEGRTSGSSSTRALVFQAIPLLISIAAFIATYISWKKG